MGEAKRRLAAVKMTRVSLVDEPAFDADATSAFNLATKQLAARALKQHGLSAFDCTRMAAAIHEAGHCIIHRMHGVAVTECMIEMTHYEGKEVWLGKTEVGGGMWNSTPDSDPYDDLDCAASTFAGVCAEMVFYVGYKLGSSLDEVVLFQMLCAIAADKLGLDPHHMVTFMHDNVELMLKHNRAAHADITRKLLEQESLGAARLAEILDGVVPVGKRAWKAVLPPPHSPVTPPPPAPPPLIACLPPPPPTPHWKWWWRDGDPAIYATSPLGRHLRWRRWRAQ